jgi:hypothetical protein
METLPVYGPVKGQFIFALSMTWIALCTTVLILRFWSRLTIHTRPGDPFSHRRLYWDDWLALAAWVRPSPSPCCSDAHNYSTAIHPKCPVPRCVFARLRYGQTRRHAASAALPPLLARLVRHVSHVRFRRRPVSHVCVVFLQARFWHDESYLCYQFLDLSGGKCCMVGHHVVCCAVQLCAC